MPKQNDTKPKATPKADADELAKRHGPPPEAKVMPEPLAPLGRAPAPIADDPNQEIKNYTPSGDAVPMDPAQGLSPDAQQPFESVEDFEKRTGYRHNDDPRAGVYDARVKREQAPN